jgi:hypothetical protein
LKKRSKKKKEIAVRAPDYIPKVETVFKDTTGTEALDVFKVAQRVGKYFSLIILFFGIVLSVISIYNITISTNIFLNSLFLTVLGLAGVINIICGLLLLAKK